MERLEKISCLKAEDVKNLKSDIEAIIKLADALETIDADVCVDYDGGNLREDSKKPSFNREDMLSNSKGAEDGFIIVPKVVG